MNHLSENGLLLNAEEAMGRGANLQYGVPGAAAGSEKLDSGKQISTHSGREENVTHTINVVEKCKNVS
jgi:hypothetical protein